MAKVHHDLQLLKRLAIETGKPAQYLREQASRKAGRLGISSAAALVLWAKEEGVSITRALNKLPPDVRTEVRSAQGAQGQVPPRRQAAAGMPRARAEKAEPISSATIGALLQDPQLHDRCKDLLLAKKHFDRAIREATTILDDRLKTKSGIKNMNPVNLVGKVLTPDPQKAVIVVSTNADEQEGFHAICKGVMLAFRNKAHHALSDKFTREGALKFCGFTDTLLAAIEQADLHLERV
ncbi:MAG: TIGR02391 family protein [Acidobacteriia bacterium]|nr:TIGR02391 family protein [Terriglobia bacterium]